MKEYKIIEIDVGNIPSSEVDEYMKKCICEMREVPYVKPTLWIRFKNWMKYWCSPL